MSRHDDYVGDVAAQAAADVVVGVDLPGVDGRRRLPLPALGEREQRPAGSTGNPTTPRCPSRTVSHADRIRRVRTVLRRRRRSVCLMHSVSCSTSAGKNVSEVTYFVSTGTRNLGTKFTKSVYVRPEGLHVCRQKFSQRVRKRRSAVWCNLSDDDTKYVIPEMFFPANLLA